jgi:HlyD family secretion protein
MIDLKQTDSKDSTHAQFLPTVHPEEFLPPIGRWATLGGLVMLGGLSAAMLLSAVLRYQVVVKAPASVRPTGELRLVQAATEGKVEDIQVQGLQSVKAGEVIAVIDDSRLQTRQRQLQSNIQQAELQLRQIEAQRQALEQQIAAQTAQVQGMVGVAKADLALNQRTYQNRQVVSWTEVQEAEAALALAEDELSRYQSLAKTGAVAELQVREKEAAVQVATARVQRSRASLNPSSGEVDRAQDQIAQEQARGVAMIARLTQEQAQLWQHQQELETQLENDYNDLQQVDAELKNTVIRAPIDGKIQNLTLRNRDQVVQVGEAIAQIAPASEDLTIKALVAAQDIGKVEVGQSVRVRISACPYPDYGTLPGAVQAISPDAEPAPAAPTDALKGTQNMGSYTVTIQPERSFLQASKQQCQIQAGMEGRADIISRQETVLQFILRKARLLSDHL